MIELPGKLIGESPSSEPPPSSSPPVNSSACADRQTMPNAATRATPYRERQRLTDMVFSCLEPHARPPTLARLRLHTGGRVSSTNGDRQCPHRAFGRGRRGGRVGGRRCDGVHHRTSPATRDR